MYSLPSLFETADSTGANITVISDTVILHALYP